MNRGLRRFAPPLALVVAAATLAACGGGQAAGGSRGAGRRALPSPAPIPTVAAKSATIKPSLTIAGIIAPYQNVGITATLSEPVTSVLVSEGDHVVRGQTLAVLDTTDLNANLAAAEATIAADDARVAQAKYTANLAYGQVPDQVRQAQATLLQAQQTLAQAEQDLGRDRQLVSAGYIPAQQYAQQQTVVANDATAVRSAQAALASVRTSQSVTGNSGSGLQAANVQSAAAEAQGARASADQIRAQIARSVIVSPVDGTVVNRNLNPGEYPGSRTAFTIQALAQVYAMLNASSADIFRIVPGSYVRLRAGDDRSGRVYAGKVVAVLGQIQPGSTNFTVKALVNNPDGRLQSGVPITATVALPETRGIGIPTSAFLDDTHTTVLLDVHNIGRVANVRELGTDGANSIVSGIPSGAVLVANGQLGLQPDKPIVQIAGRRGGPAGGPPGASGASAAGAPASDAAGAPGADGSPAPGASGAPRRHRRKASPDPNATPGATGG